MYEIPLSINTATYLIGLKMYETALSTGFISHLHFESEKSEEQW